MPSVSPAINIVTKEPYRVASPVFGRINYAFRDINCCGAILKVVCIALSIIFVIPALVELGAFIAYKCRSRGSEAETQEHESPFSTDPIAIGFPSAGKGPGADSPANAGSSNDHRPSLLPRSVSRQETSQRPKLQQRDVTEPHTGSSLSLKTPRAAALIERLDLKPRSEELAQAPSTPSFTPSKGLFSQLRGRPLSPIAEESQESSSAASQDSTHTLRSEELSPLFNISPIINDAEYNEPWKKELCRHLDDAIYNGVYKNYACKWVYAYLRGGFYDLKAEKQADSFGFRAVPHRDRTETYRRHSLTDMEKFKEYLDQNHWKLALSSDKSKKGEPRRSLMLLPPKKLAASNINTFLSQQIDGQGKPIELTHILRRQIISVVEKLKTPKGLKALIRENGFNEKDAKYIRDNFSRQYVTISTDGTGVDYLHVRFEFFDPNGPEGKRGPKWYKVEGGEPEMPASAKAKATASASGGLTLVKKRQPQHKKMYRPLTEQAADQQPGVKPAKRSPSVETLRGQEGSLQSTRKQHPPVRPVSLPLDSLLGHKGPVPKAPDTLSSGPEARRKELAQRPNAENQDNTTRTEKRIECMMPPSSRKRDGKYGVFADPTSIYSAENKARSGRNYSKRGGRSS